jgi:hypothetical protein
MKISRSSVFKNVLSKKKDECGRIPTPRGAFKHFYQDKGRRGKNPGLSAPLFIPFLLLPASKSFRSVGLSWVIAPNHCPRLRALARLAEPPFARPRYEANEERYP